MCWLVGATRTVLMPVSLGRQQKTGTTTTNLNDLFAPHPILPTPCSNQHMAKHPLPLLHQATTPAPASAGPTTGDTAGALDLHSEGHDLFQSKVQDDLAYQCLKGQGFKVKNEKIQLLANFIYSESPEKHSLGPMVPTATQHINLILISNQSKTSCSRSWNANFLASALTRIALLLEESQKWSENRNLDPVIWLHCVATLIMEKVQEACINEQARMVSEASKQRKLSNSTSKMVIHPQYGITLSQEKRSPFPCPDVTCLHFMLMPLNYGTEVKKINDKQQQEQQAAVAQWICGGKKGSKHSKKKPMSLLLGCFCCMQNDLNRPSGIGCVMCKEAMGRGTTIEDPEYGNKLCACPSCLCNCKMIFPLEKRQDVAMAKLWGASTERDSLKTPEQQRDIFTTIVENYTSQSIDAIVKQNGSYSSSTVNHGLGLAGLAAIHDPKLGHLMADKKLLHKTWVSLQQSFLVVNY
jgi:hypothetical protein